MNDEEREFAENINRLLIAHGRHFKGIRLRCRKCGEPAMAESVPTAELFGWAAIVHRSGPDYDGLCIGCAPKNNAGIPPDHEMDVGP